MALKRYTLFLIVVLFLTACLAHSVPGVVFSLVGAAFVLGAPVRWFKE